MTDRTKLLRRGPRGFRVWAPIAGAGVALALLAGCGGGSPASSTGGTAGPTATASAGGGAAAQSAGAGGGDAAEFGLPTAEIERRQIKVESLIQQCMKKQGFDYLPVDPAILRTAMESNSRPSGMTDQAFRQQFGYGITTLYDAQLKQAQASQGEPNRKIRAALGAADRAAYDRALYGENPSATFAAALDSEDLGALGGCTKEAVDPIFPAAELRRLLTTGQDAVGQRALNDPRVVAATRSWSDCMRQAGFTYAKPEDIKSDFQGRLAAVVGAGARVAPVGAAAAPAYDAAQLTSLQADEIRVAVADATCAGTSGLKKVKDAVEAELAKTMGG